MLVEVLLSMMSKESSSLRTTVNTVFSLLASHMTGPALTLIIDVLLQKRDDKEGPLAFQEGIILLLLFLKSIKTYVPIKTIKP